MNNIFIFQYAFLNYQIENIAIYANLYKMSILVFNKTIAIVIEGN